jgi:hypothetical protein
MEKLTQESAPALINEENEEKEYATKNVHLKI